MFRTLHAAAALSVAGVLSFAAPLHAQDPVQAAADAYVSADGYEQMNPEHIVDALGDVLGGDPDAMIPADVDISPIEKALLLIETQEVPLSRVRYVLRYNQQTIDDITVSFVDVQRYNLGPAIREETVAAYDAENTAEPEAFGVGPHVAWRFVTQPAAKSAALLLAAGRKEISEADAAATDCLPRACLSLDSFDGLIGWSEPVTTETPRDDVAAVAYPAILETPAYYGDDLEIEMSPAYMALQLGVAAGIADTADGISWNIPVRQGPDSDSPYLVVLIDRNFGQEIMSEAALGIGKLGLDSEERWVRLGAGVFDGIIYETLFTAEGQLLN